MYNMNELKYDWGGLISELYILKGTDELLNNRSDLRDHISHIIKLEESKTVEEVKEGCSYFSDHDRRYLGSKLLDELCVSCRRVDPLEEATKKELKLAVAFLDERTVKSTKIEEIKRGTYDPTDYNDPCDWKLLYNELKRNNIEGVKQLYEQQYINKGAWSIFYLIASNPEFIYKCEALKFLIERNPAKYADETYLIMAFENNIPVIVNLLLDLGVPDNRYTNNDWLRCACVIGSTQLVQRLLDSGADIHYRNDICLRLAVYKNHKEVVELLLDRGANVHANNDDALRTARMFNRTEMIKLLLGRGAST